MQDAARIHQAYPDPVLEALSGTPADMIYLDQLYLRSGWRAHHIGQLIDTWEYEARAQGAAGFLGAIPIAPWKNRSSIALAAHRGLCRQGRVQEHGVTLGIFGKRYHRVGEPLQKTHLNL